MRLGGWEVFEFNKKTEPTKRHKIIKQFQDGLKKDGKPKLCVATYATAAVGVTLTAANRVFLMEPSPDPATELQAAGRIHRLGQTKEVLIKRFAFRNTIEHAIVDLHEEIKAKRLKAGAKNSDPIVQQVFKKLNLHKEVHTATARPVAATRSSVASSTKRRGNLLRGGVDLLAGCCQRRCVTTRRTSASLRGSWPDRLAARRPVHGRATRARTSTRTSETATERRARQRILTMDGRRGRVARE